MAPKINFRILGALAFLAVQIFLLYAFQSILYSNVSASTTTTFTSPLDVGTRDQNVTVGTQFHSLAYSRLKEYDMHGFDPLDDEVVLEGFIDKPLTIESARLCDEEVNVVLKYSWKCPRDPTCLSCTRTAQEKFYDLLQAFKGPEDVNRKRRLEAVFKHFGRPSKDLKTFNTERNETQPLRKRSKNEDTIIMLMAVNYGQLYLVLNWACSVQKIGLDPTLLAYIIPTDKKSYTILKQMGFLVEDPSWVNQLKFKISTEYRGNANTGGHAQINNAVLLAGNELVQAGYEIVFHDVDMTWHKDIRPWLKVAGHRRDLLGMKAPYWNAKGIINSGFVYVANTQKSRRFIQSLENLAPLKIVSDQLLWNIAVRHVYFSEISYRILPQTLFYKYSGHRMPRPGNEMLLYHAVGNHKREHMELHDTWYLNETECPRYFAITPQPPITKTYKK